MGLKLSIWENAARIRAELRIGAAVVLVRGQTGVLAGAAESLTAERLEDFRATGPTDMVITSRRARPSLIVAGEPTAMAPEGTWVPLSRTLFAATPRADVESIRQRLAKKAA